MNPLTLIFPAFSIGQYSYGFHQESFLGRQARAQAEAMDSGYSFIDGGFRIN